jgi:hypothetical protein
MELVRALSGIALVLSAACGPASKRETPPPPPANDAEERAVAAPAPRDPLGLVAGASWIFQGTWTRFDDAAGKDVATPLTWTTTVVDVTERKGEVVYRVTGWPGDAPEAPARETVIVVSEDMIRLGGGEGSEWLRLPVREGDRVCDEESTYCWSVEAAGTGHDVILRTRPDVTIYHLEPGRGVTRFEYHHNGTTDDLVLERVD